MDVKNMLGSIKRYFRRNAASDVSKRKNYLVIIAVNKPMRDVHLMIDFVGLPKIKSLKGDRSASH